ncbi:hypothetical protein B0H10DRAFT_2439911 [Mycena sp. CBHHK59/15]|nr:hypothetical protein B0H10DRAFT_2439911 [Mycena sp. CBHHK59/15]
MPVDKTKAPHISKRAVAEYQDALVPGASGVSHSRELEVKRNRGEVSCAECRRLKIKCDKQIPCQSCVRRGCAALCPNGALATGQGTRFVLAATEHLHRKIARMGERIRALEDALTRLSGGHPLLEGGEDFGLSVPEPGAGAGNGGGNAGGNGSAGEGDGWTPQGVVLDPAASAGGDVIDAFGTLSISDHGISRFFGPTGGCESLLLANIPSSPSASASASASSPSSLSLSRSSQSLSPPSTHASAPTSPLSRSHQSHPSASSSHTSSSSPHNRHSPASLFSPSSFPLTPLGPPRAILALLTSHLPQRARARVLVRSYFAQLAWLFRGVTRGQVGDMVRGVYVGRRRPARAREDGDGDGQQKADEAEEDYTGPHDLALLFMVFAVGALVVSAEDAEDEHEHHEHMQAAAAEAEHLHQIARAALALQSVLEKPSLVTIQALHLLSIYTAMSGGVRGPGAGLHVGGGGGGSASHSSSSGADDAGETSMEMTWSLITLAAHLSQTIGLHRDSARWGLSAKMVQRRRILFWDLFVADVWQSLNTGRPPSFSLAYIDCSFPQYENQKAKDGAFEVWQFRFAAECVAEVTSRTLTAEAPSYTTIMELDRKVREFPLPPLDEPGADDVGASLQRCVLEHIRETVLMYIHRSFFAQAIIEQPENPLKSTYAPSFLAAYRASATILKSVREQFAVMPNACARFWTMWTFAFSAAVVFGTVVTRGPRSPLAASAMTELEQACVLFSKAAVYSRRATKALPILTKLKEKAHYALAATQSNSSPVGGDNGGLLWNMTGVLGPGGLPVKMQRGGQGASAGVAFPPHPARHQQQQQQPRVHMQGEEMQYDSYEVQRQRQSSGVQYPPHQQQPHARQRQHSMPSSSTSALFHHGVRPHPQDLPPQAHHAHAQRPAPTVNVDVSLNWDPREYPHSAQDYVHASPASALDERRLHHQQQPQPYYSADGARLQPPAAPYAWPVDTYAEPRQQHHHQDYQQYEPPPAMYGQPHPQQQQQAAYQAHNAELARLGLAARDSRLDERWSTFMEDSGLLDGTDFRAR